MDSSRGWSEMVTSVIRFTIPKTLTVSHEQLPILILFYFTFLYQFSHPHVLPLEGATDMPWTRAQSSAVLGQPSQGYTQNHKTHADKVPKT